MKWRGILLSKGAQMTLTKAELADMLFEKVGLNKREAKDMVETFFEEIRLALENGESVKLSGFGNFQLRNKPQRPGRNPKTGEEIPITARRVVTFHASQKLKALVEQTHEAPVGDDLLDAGVELEVRGDGRQLLGEHLQLSERQRSVVVLVPLRVPVTRPVHRERRLEIRQ